MKKALITGGATGIGKATPLLLQKNGYEVYITYNSTLPDYEVNKIKCDLKSLDDIKRVFDEVGDIDLLVNNAGVSMIKMINDVTPDDYEEVTAVNERAVYFASKHAALSMIKKHSGAIINISSIWGQCGASCETLYSMTKAGVIGLTKALAQELALSGNAARALIGDARSEAEKEKAKLLGGAHAEAEALHKQIRERISTEETQTRAELDAELPELVGLLTEQLLGEGAADGEAISRRMRESDK